MPGGNLPPVPSSSVAPPKEVKPERTSGDELEARGERMQIAADALWALPGKKADLDLLTGEEIWAAAMGALENASTPIEQLRREALETKSNKKDKPKSG